MTTKTRPRTTKKARLIKMLSAKAGADIATISGKLGWQGHTVRAAITGLRKAGFEITTERREDGKPARYRIAAKSKPVAHTAKAITALETVNAG